MTQLAGVNPSIITSVTSSGAGSSLSCNFPVCPNSPPQCIIQAFQLSGYWGQLNSQQQQAAQSNPSGWLSGHPYLYNTYAAYFTSNCSQSGAYQSNAASPPIWTPLTETPDPSTITNLSDIQLTGWQGCVDTATGPVCSPGVQNQVTTSTGSQTVQQNTSNQNPVIAGAQDLYGAFYSFGGFLEHFFGQSLPNFFQGGASAFATAVEALGKYPIGGLLLVGIIILFFILAFFI